MFVYANVMMELSPKPITTPNVYWRNFLMLCDDLEESFRYVQPSTQHLQVYSLRYYELLLRACTEFESLCKEKIVEFKLSTKAEDKMSIHDYSSLNSHFENKPCKMGVGYYFEEPYFVYPLKEWEKTGSLTWYGDYNKVKHNRAKKFRLANLENVLLAVGGLFILLERSKLCPQGKLAYMPNDSQYERLRSHPDWPVILSKG